MFKTSNTCHELGICQRTAPQCRRVCHIAKAGDEPPIGYEAARTSNVRALRAEHEAQLNALKTTPTNRDEEEDRPAGTWDMGQRVLIGALCLGLVLSLVGLVLISMADPGYLLLDLMAAREALAAVGDFLRAISSAALQVGS